MLLCNEFTVDVTYQHYLNGIPRFTSYCPIALSLSEYGYIDPNVSQFFMSMRDNENIYSEWTHSASMFVRQFDSYAYNDCYLDDPRNVFLSSGKFTVHFYKKTISQP